MDDVVAFTSPVARFEREDRIAVLTIDNPPVNALGQAARQALLDVVHASEADSGIDALVVLCAGRTFCAGADVREFARTPAQPALPAVVAAIEASAKPVVAALHGTALGGGLEVALACHYRLAVASASLGLPEVKLGLIPGSGGTQRLPRLVGVAKALDMMVGGEPIAASEAQAFGLLNAIIEPADMRGAAVAFARSIVGKPLLRTRDRTGKLDAARRHPELFASYEKANASTFRGNEAAHAIVAALRAGLELPFAEALAIERTHFERLRGGPQSRALRYAFFAERKAAKVPGITADTPVRDIASVGVIGAGTMGTGIAIAMLAAGLPVTLVETAEETLRRSADMIRKTVERRVERGRMARGAAERALAGLLPTGDAAALGAVDLVIEAAFETMEVKKGIFARLDSIAKPTAILATNTSYLDVDAIAAATSRPEQVLGMHFFSPANVMKLLEIVRGARTSAEVLATALAVGRRAGKIAVVVGNAPGFVGNRMLAVRRREAEAMILEGASPYEVDRVAEAFGFPMGPFRVGDLAGLDLGWSRESSTGATIRERLCERDRRGQKSGAGYYDYVDGKAMPSSDVETLIAAFAAEKGIARRRVPEGEIRARLLYPMINEGVRILEHGKATRASDIDVVWIYGYGWPVVTGGPMYYGDSVGLDEIIAALERLGPDNRPASLLRETAATGGQLSEIDLSLKTLGA